MRIAIIDDRADNIKITIASLKKEQAINEDDQIDSFLTPEEFITQYEAHESSYYSLLIVDQDLKNKTFDGCTLLKHIQDKGYGNNAVILTADDSAEMVDKIKQMNVEYVVKYVYNATYPLLADIVMRSR